MDVCLLKNEFNRDFRPLLAANYLLLPRGIKDVTTAFAHGQIHGVNKKEPLYLTALDVVIRVKGLLDEEKLHLREHLIACRVHISDDWVDIYGTVDDWVDTYGTVEILKYNFGPRGTVRGEIDASFKEVVKADGSRIGQADISMIIWSGN